MKTLHLNLKSKWFKMIFLGLKPEEYREIKQYWVSKFVGLIVSDFVTKTYIQQIIDGDYQEIEFMDYYDTITFSNGYSRDRPQFEIEFKGIEIKEGNPEWGAEPGKKYFVLKLGEILNDRNCARFVLENMEN